METSLDHTFSRLLRPVKVKRTNIVEVMNHGRMLIIEGRDITHLKGDGNYTFIHTRHGKRYLVSKTMKTIQGNLAAGFLRTPKSYSVNADYVVSWLAPFCLLLSSGAKIPVARRRIRLVEELLEEEYLRVG